MKNLKTIISIFVVVILSISCSKEDEKPPSLIGKWEFVKQIDYEPNNVLGPEKEPDFNSPNCNKGYFEFKENNQLFFGIYDRTSCNFALAEGRYIFDGKFISAEIIVPFNGSIIIIKTLSATDLVIDFREQSSTPTNILLFRFILKRIQ